MEGCIVSSIHCYPSLNFECVKVTDTSKSFFEQVYCIKTELV